MAKSRQFHKKANSEGMSHRIFDDVVDLASTLFRNRKAIGADLLRTLAAATQNYAAAMTDLPTLQQQVELASENMGNFADYVLNTDIKHMVSDATVLARRRPLIVVGVAAAAGLAASRLVMSSSIPTAPTKKRSSRPKKASKSSSGLRRTVNGTGHAHP